MATQYVVHSVVRARHNRTERAGLPQKPRTKQYIGSNQQRLTQNRPLVITEDQLRAGLEEFRQKQAAHILEVRTLDGRKMDLTTLQPLPPAASALTTPEFPLDSVNNDKNFPGIPGHFLSRGIGGDDLTVPQVLQGDAKPALFKDAAQHAERDMAEPIEEPVADIDALVEEAQAAASGEEESEEEAAPVATEEVSSDKKGKRRNR